MSYHLQFTQWLNEHNHNPHGSLYVLDDDELFTYCNVHHHPIVTAGRNEDGTIICIDLGVAA